VCRIKFSRPPDPVAGFTFIEVLVAMALLAGLAVGACGLATVAFRSTADSRLRTVAVHAAVERLEQLRSLSWGMGDASLPIPFEDLTTNLSVTPPVGGGPGLNPAPGALTVSVLGYVDFLDHNGRWLSAGVTPPPDSAFTRRWSVSRVPGRPNQLLLQVVVSRSQGGNGTDVVHLTTVKTRKAY
jgi:prepilin-type N-terminal cleavage/methylation domain-containing protein